MSCALIHITGVVQGVGMRPFVYREAVAHGVRGWVLNAGDGVRIKADADDEALHAFIHALRAHAPAAARIEDIRVEPTAPLARQEAAAGFSIVASQDSVGQTTLVSPDIATCDDCLRELFDPADRRYHYPFINCTNCGPRFTIIRSLPYDRAATSMDAFPMCPGCDDEYRDPADRRFHAQPNACFDCGPHLTWRERGKGTVQIGDTLDASDAIIDRCASLLAEDGIVAIKGLGGFHLACDAGSEAAVQELRRRKRRSKKPLAVMVRDLETAQQLGYVNSAEAEALGGSIRPIVLLRRRADMRPQLAESLAYDLPELGVMLPYTPLQHLLLAACANRGLRALVMTSGNMSGNPIEIDDGAAWERLVVPGIADALMGNNRKILARFDDSVVRVVGGQAQMVRRARGFAPMPIALPALIGTAPSVLACGPEQKATFAITREGGSGAGSLCFLSQHIGDLENTAAFQAWRDAAARTQGLFDLMPLALACDLHPGYLSSQWAHGRAAETGIPLVEVQHHHAHVASVIAEAASRGRCDADEKVIGIALDGTGAGGVYDLNGALAPDGTVWGGEILVADLTRFVCAAHLRTWRLPGGAAAIREPERSAFALLHDFDLLDHPGAKRLLDTLSTQTQDLLATMLERQLNCPETSSAGRLFDAVAAILGVCDRATYEGEPAIELEAAAWRSISCEDGGDLAAQFRYGRSEERGASVVPAPVTANRPNLAQGHAATTDMPPASPSWACPTCDESSISELGGHIASSARIFEASGLQKSVAPCATIDTRSLIEAVLDGIAAGEATERLAADFHRAFATLIADAALTVGRRTGIRTAALSGGVFMNRLILTGVTKVLEQAELTVLTPHDLPFNDGCIAYGQAAIARAHFANNANGSLPR